MKRSLVLKMEVPGRVTTEESKAEVELEGAVSDEAPTICRICERNGQTNDAHVFCLECWEHFCNNCGRVHRATLQSSQHQLLDKSDMPKKAFKTRHMCESHPGTMLEYFCKERDELLCRHCVTLNHQGCRGDDLILNICSRPEDSDLTKIYHELQSTEQKLHQEQSEIEYDVETIKMNKFQSKNSINSFKKELHTFVDHLVDSMYTEVDNCVDAEEEMRGMANRKCDTMLTEVQDLLMELDIKMKSKDKVQLFIAKKTAEKAEGMLRHSIESIRSRNCIRKFGFKPAKQLQDMMRSVQKLGQLTVEGGADIESASDECFLEASQELLVEGEGRANVDTGETWPHSASDVDIDIERAVDTTPSPTARDVLPLSSSFNRTMATKSEEISSLLGDLVDIQRSLVTGIETLDNGRIVTCDYLTKYVKVFAIRVKRVLHGMPLQESPWDLTMINRSMLAVTCPDGRYIQLLSLSVSLFRGALLSLDQQIRVQGRCFGIQYVGEGNMAVTFDNKAKVQIIDMSGTILRDFSTDPGGNALFVDPTYIALSLDRQCMYISDSVNNSVTGMALDGKVQFTYVDDQLKCPKGITVGDDGSIYVCADTSCNIHMVSSIGRKVKVLLGDVDGVRHPFGIVYNSRDSKLYVGMQDNNNIVTFTLHR